jgi:hypothetical protein
MLSKCANGVSFFLHLAPRNRPLGSTWDNDKFQRPLQIGVGRCGGAG